ncbi:MAG: hypothetical protein MUD16_14180 [Desulfobacterales bacterium]|jgi:hypothetical protein|nr:hypothetical protein [Desulfobacterales bacterium]
MKFIFERRLSAVALAAALALAGCAGSPKEPPTFQHMNALAAAGFDLKMADTPAKLERIGNLPQLQLAQVDVKGRQLYVYADAHGCRCVYAGDEDAYRRLLYQARQQQIDQRSYWAQEHTNRSTYSYKGEPIHWGDIIMITGSDVDLDDLRGND